MQRDKLNSSSMSSIRKDLRTWLPGARAGEDESSLYIHLGDLQAACSKVANIIENLPKIDHAASMDLAQRVTDLQVELYDHLLPHVLQLREPLQAWRARLLEQVELK